MSSLFARNFDEELEAEECAAAERDNAQPSPSPDEIAEMIEQAREAGRAAGHEQGRQEAALEAAAALDARVAAGVENLAPQLDSLLSGMTEHRDQVEQDLSNLLFSICEKAIPLVVEKHSKYHLQAELSRIVRRAQGSRWLEVRCSNAEADSLRHLMEVMHPASGKAQEVRVIGDESFEPGTVKASWHNGRSAWSHERISRKILESLSGETEPHQPQQGIAKNE